MFDAVAATLRTDPVDELTRSQLAGRFEQLRVLKGAIAAYEARLVNATDHLGDHGLDGAGMLRSAGRMSSRAAKTAARVAESLEALPRTSDALATGKITAEHAAAVADAATKVSPERADSELIDGATAAPADVFAKRTREWTGRNRTDHDATAEDHRRQRRNRHYRHWTDDDGMALFLLATDRVTGADIHQRMSATVDRLWHADGGRDGAPDEVRTAPQRAADAFAELLCADPASEPQPHPRRQLSVVYDIAGQTTPDGAPLATLVADGQPLPAPVLEHLACTSDITPVLFNGPGRPIWVGRDHRRATIAQWRALIARDRGCVGCGADPDRCEAHHINPWHTGGPTDIDNLVLVCSRCHHDLHDRGHTLRRTDDRWHIEPRHGPAPLPRSHRDAQIADQLRLTA